MRPSAPASVALAFAALALFSASSASGQFEQQPGSGQQGDSDRFELRGKVVNSVTGEGVPHALVQMYASGEKAVFSDDDGGFDFTDVPRGSFAVVARKPGFFNSQELRRGNFNPYPTMVAVPQETEAVVKLTPEGIIYGRLLDENQEPIEDVNVQAQTWITQDGRRRLLSVANAVSDDQGDFRLAELSPGTYLLRFSTRTGGRPGNLAFLRTSEQEGYGTQFYPGVADPAAAEAIRVKAGAQVKIEQTLAPQRVYEISGVVRGAQANNGFGLNLMDSTGESVQARTQVNERTGEFRLQGVPAGTYILTAMSWSRNGGDQQPENAYVPVRVKANVSGLTIVLGRGASIRVELDDERSETSMPAGAPRVWVNLASEMPQFNRGIAVPPPAEDRRAPRQFEGLAPGTYKVEAMPNGPGYVAAVRCGSLDLLRSDLVVPADGALPPIQVTLRSDGGQIFVMAVKAGEPASAMVVVYSEDYPRQSRSGWFSGSGSMGWGVFPPGRYRVVAVENAADLEFRNPAVMEKYLEHAVEVNLAPGDQKNVRVEVQEFQETAETPGTDR